MIFIRGLIGLDNGNELSSQLSAYIGHGRFCFGGREKDPIFPKSSVEFLEHKQKNFRYVIHVKSLLPTSKHEPNEYFFPIVADSNLCRYFLSETEKELSGFEWNLDNGTKVSFEFHNRLLGPSQAEEFQELFCKLLYQINHKQLVTKSTKPEEYLCYCNDTLVEIEEAESGDFSLLVKQIEQMQPSFDTEDVEISEEMKTDSKPAVQIKEERQYNNANDHNLAEATELKIDTECNILLSRISADLIQMDSTGSSLHVASDVQVSVLDYGDFNVKLIVTDSSGKTIMSRQLTNELNYDLDTDKALLKWVDASGDDLVIRGLKMKTSESDAKTLKFLVAKSIVEHRHKESVEDLYKKDEIDYVKRMIIEDSDKENEETYSDSSYEYEEEEMTIEDNHVKAKTPVKDGKKNTGHAQAKVLDRFFVSKGSTISAYLTDPEETEFDFILDLPIVKTLEGREISPKKMMLHEQDCKMILVNENTEKKVFYMDLEKGKVIEELGTEGENTIRDIISLTKHSSFSTDPCFLALNPRNVFKMDPRISGPNKIASQKIYTKPPKFTCIASTESEHFATGSELGEIRLFKEVGQNAKNLFPGLGDPIIGIDTTKDSKWLLATTKKYLVLLPTFSSEKNGYTHPLGKEKALPKKLQLSLEDICKNGIKEVNFTPAKFNDSKEGKEKFIVTSTGEFIVTWNFAQVIRGKNAKYEIKNIEDRVIMNEFRFNHDDSVYVTTPNEVRIQKTRLASLKKYAPK